MPTLIRRPICDTFILNMDTTEALIYLREKKKEFVESPQLTDALLTAQFKKLAKLCMVAKVESIRTGKRMKDMFNFALLNILPYKSELLEPLDSHFRYNAFREDPFKWCNALVSRNIALNEISHELRGYDSELGFNLFLAVFPCENVYPLSPNTIGIPFGGEALLGDRNMVWEEFFELSRMEEFPIWTCLDVPDNISDEEWDERVQLWKKAMPTGDPLNDGYQFSIFSAKREKIPALTLETVEKLFAEQRESLVDSASWRWFYDEMSVCADRDEPACPLVPESLLDVTDKATQAAMRAEIQAKVESSTPQTFKELLNEFGATVSEE